MMLTYLLLAFACTVHITVAQVPRVCVQNATQVNSTCCPSVPGKETLGPCGGTSRGSCSAVTVNVAGKRSTLTGPPAASEDTRVDWPAHVFQYACKCKFFYSGYACQNTALNETLPPWRRFISAFSKNNTRVRKNANNLTEVERKRFVDVLLQAKEKQSDYVILNDTSQVNADGTKIISYFNVSVYDYYAFLNYYATKGVYFTPIEEDVEMADSSQSEIDYAHQNPNFIPFHRALLQRFEEELNQIAAELEGGTASSPFALPYWNWTDQKTCDVCTDSLVGAIDPTNVEGRLSDGSSFSSWQVACDESSDHPCDPEVERPFISRAYSSDPLYQTLPTAAEVEFALNATYYDTAPYNETSNSSSFRNLLEGFIGQDNNLTAMKLGKRYMGMQVRNYLNGTWTDLALGPNDPLFWLHQAFLDLLYDKWQTKNTGSSTAKLPENVTAKGQGRQDNLVGFFPTFPSFLAMSFPISTFQYSYEIPAEMVAASVESDGTAQAAEPAKSSTSFSFWGIFSVFGIVIAAVGFLIYYRRRRRRMFRYVDPVAMDDIDSEKTRLLK